MPTKSFKTIRDGIKNTPFFIMLIFGIAHLMVYIQIDIGGKQLSFSFINQIVSMVYLVSVYLWALFASEKRFVKITAVVMGFLSVSCVLISLRDFGQSINDALCTGGAVLSLLYVFENAEKLLQMVKKYDKLITIVIWSFFVFSVVLFLFFPDRCAEWGEGTFLFGHRYASVCCMMIIIITLKLLNRPKNSLIYWVVLLLCYAICFWTGARIYVICGLGTVYAVLFTFRKSTKDFLLRCAAVTLASIVLFFASSTATKFENIVINIEQVLSEAEAEERNDDTSYIFVNFLANGRLFMWKNCVQSYQKLPLINKLLGSGNKYIYDYNVGLHSHMDYLNILHFNGLSGLLIYLFIFVGYVGTYWRKHRLPVILLIGLWGVWFAMAFLNGYVNYTANMMSLPYIVVMAMAEGKLYSIDAKP